MSTVQEIEAAIEKLPPEEVRNLADWLTSNLPRLDSKMRMESLRKARGIWKDRSDLKSVRSLRSEWDRRLGA